MTVPGSRAPVTLGGLGAPTAQRYLNAALTASSAPAAAAQGPILLPPVSGQATAAAAALVAGRAYGVPGVHSSIIARGLSQGSAAHLVRVQQTSAHLEQGPAHLEQCATAAAAATGEHAAADAAAAAAM